MMGEGRRGVERELKRKEKREEKDKGNAVSFLVNLCWLATCNLIFIISGQSG